MSDEENKEIARLWREAMEVWVRGFDYRSGTPRHITDPYGRGIKDALGQLCTAKPVAPFTPCDMIVNGVVYRPNKPLDPRWSDPEDIQSFLHDRSRPMSPMSHSLIDQYIKLHEQQTKEAMTKFKKGDEVRVNSLGSGFSGRIGTVREKVDSVANKWHVEIVGYYGSYIIDEEHLTLVDQPLSTTPDKVLQAAKTSPQAKDALKALFPDVFKESGQPFEFGWSYAIPCNNSNHPLSIGIAGVPFSPLEGRCLVMDNSLWEMKTQQYNGRTVLTFHKKP